MNFCRIRDIPTRFVFESALELINETKVGTFQMRGSSSSEGNLSFTRIEH